MEGKHCIPLLIHRHETQSFGITKFAWMNGSRAQIATVYPNCDMAHVYAVLLCSCMQIEAKE